MPIADPIQTQDQAPPAAVSAVAARSHDPLDDRRRSFLRMVSHELRTPLNSVIGFSEIISQELHGPIGDPRYATYAGIIRDSGLKLLKLVNQVLEIARLEAGAAEMMLTPEPPAAAALAAVRALETEAASRNVECRVDVDPLTPMVLADARGLHTILTNLIQNAIAFSPETGVVRIDIFPHDGGVALQVADEGEGVPSDDIARLIQPFEQGENALTRRAQGAGLGLSIVQLLCDDMGGSLHLSSKPGQGLVARVRLPSVVAVKATAFDGRAARLDVAV